MYKITKKKTNSSYYPETIYYPMYNGNYFIDETKKEYVCFKNKKSAKEFLKKFK